MTSVSDSTAYTGLTAQLQAAVTKTAFNVQKQEGENAVKLIESAAQESTSIASSNDHTKSTGNNVDILA